jgi:hypothetical protein
MKLRRFCQIGLASALLAGSQSFSLAADLGELLPPPVPVEEPVGPRLSANIIPLYGWLPGMKGTVGAGGGGVDVDVTPIDIISNLSELVQVLDGLYMGAGEIQYGKVGVLYDAFYMSVGTNVSFFGGPGVDFGFSQFMGTLAPSYRVHESERGYIDAIAGVRYWDINMNVNNASTGASWVDPIIGAKGRLNLSEKVYVDGWAMIGGFGVGSKFSWDVWSNIGYQVHDRFDVFAGFRAVGADYQSDSFKWDLIQYGPVVGATINFN